MLNVNSEPLSKRQKTAKKKTSEVPQKITIQTQSHQEVESVSTQEDLQCYESIPTIEKSQELSSPSSTTGNSPKRQSRRIQQLINQQKSIRKLESDLHNWNWIKCKPLSPLRSQFGSTVAEGKIFVFGGVHNDRLNLVEMFDPKTKEWTTGFSMFSPRSGCACASVGNKIYLIGGTVGDSETPSNSCGIYNITTSRWSNMETMHNSREQHSVVVAKNKIYALGGYGCYGRSEVYDIDSGKWIEIKRMNQDRYGFAAVAVGTKIYCIGGKLDSKHILLSSHGKDKEHSDYLDTMEVYDIGKDEWTTFDAEMVNRRYGCSAFAAGSKIFVLGGCVDNQVTKAVEVFDIEENKWSGGTITPKFKWERKDFAVHVSGRDLFVIGGSDSLNVRESKSKRNSPSSSMEMNHNADRAQNYDIRTERKRRLCLQTSNRNDLSPRYGYRMHNNMESGSRVTGNFVTNGFVDGGLKQKLRAKKEKLNNMENIIFNCIRSGPYHEREQYLEKEVEAMEVEWFGEVQKGDLEERINKLQHIAE